MNRIGLFIGIFIADVLSGILIWSVGLPGLGLTVNLKDNYKYVDVR